MSTQGSRTSGGAVRSAAACRAVFLVGFMGAGKTSVGKSLARQINWPFEDLDERIQQGEGRAIHEIFSESGETVFREMEHHALRELIAELNDRPRVVALGGGAFAQERNAILLRQPEILSVFLDAPVEELFHRCEQEQIQRPLHRGKEQFNKLYESRKPYYMAAKVRIDTSGKEIATVAGEVAALLRERQLIHDLEGVSG